MCYMIRILFFLPLAFLELVLATFFFFGLLRILKNPYLKIIKNLQQLQKLYDKVLRTLHPISPDGNI